MFTLKYDPVEDTEEYKMIENELEEKLTPYIEELKAESERVQEEFGIYPPISHRVFAIKRRILLEDYGIIWKSPVEMNPDANID